MKTLDSINVKGKRVLVRIDLNSSFFGKKIIENSRFIEHASTIKELKKKGAVIVVIAHQGRPGKSDFTSLKQHAKILNKYVKINFVDDTINRKSRMAIERLKSGEALLLDNIRFIKDEFSPGNNSIVKAFKGKFDYFVSDAFSVFHRRQTSIVSLPKVIPSVIGRVAEKEIKNLDKIKKNLKNTIFILGGNKPKDVVLLIKRNKVLTTGELSLLTLMARGYKLGKHEKILKDKLKYIKEIKKNLRGTKTPIDLAILSKGQRKEIDLNDLPTNSLILDIGSKTIKDYQKEIRKAKAIFFKGSAGYLEKPQFDNGTKELLRTISNSKGYSVIAGGSSSSAISKFKINKKGFSHISLSGGALVHYLAGKKLPGLEVLK